MDFLIESEIAAVLRELRDAYPELRIWTEIVGHQGLHWVAKGNPRPWLVMSDDLGRFTAALARIEPASPPDDERDETGIRACVHHGPCRRPGTGAA